MGSIIMRKINFSLAHNPKPVKEEDTEHMMKTILKETVQGIGDFSYWMGKCLIIKNMVS